MTTEERAELVTAAVETLREMCQGIFLAHAIAGKDMTRTTERLQAAVVLMRDNRVHDGLEALRLMIAEVAPS